MTKPINIYLKTLDRDDLTIKQASRDVANYFKDVQTHIILEDFCELLKRSAKWQRGTVESRYKEVQNELENAYQNANINIFKLTRGHLFTAFKMADKKDKNFLNSLRGKIFEAILVGFYGGTYSLEHPPPPQQRGWGVSIGLPTKNENDVIAYYHHSGNPDLSKKTMDYAYLKNSVRVFYECKIQPDRFGDVEEQYFSLFHEKFKSFNLEHELCFFAADRFDEVEMEISDSDFDFPLHAFGYDNLASYISNHL